MNSLILTGEPIQLEDLYSVSYAKRSVEISEEAKEFRIIYDVIQGPKNHTSESNFKMCAWKNNCINLRKHELATCFVPFVMPYLSDHFDLDIPISGGIDLFDKNLNTKKLLDRKSVV